MPSKRLTRTRLIEGFADAFTPKSQWRIGGEFERAVVRSDGRSIAYDEPDGIRWILESMAEREGWDRVFEGENLIALTRDGASITLEPGGQVELSGKPHHTLSDLADEMLENRRTLLDIAKNTDHVWTAAGLTPIMPIDDIAWMPKGRYRIMRESMPKRGDLATTMMKGTCSVQANYDFSDEADCAAKVRLCAGLAPLTTAIFANSPLLENRPTGFKSYRGHVWTRTDPERTGFPPGLRADFSFERWVDYLLDTPMLFRQVDGHWQHGDSVRFGEFMREGIDGVFPTWSEWTLHMSSVFPEVRVKNTIEVRGADCVGHDLALAFCALFTGLLYCTTALDEGLELVREIEKHGTHIERFNVACRSGLEGAIGTRSLADWSSDLGEIARRGIRACLPNDSGKLEPLLDRIEQGRSPAMDLLDAWHRDPSPSAIIAAIAY